MVTNNNSRGRNEYDYKGLSTDTKPTDAGVNSLFWELDTNEFYYFDGEYWQIIGGNVE